MNFYDHFVHRLKGYVPKLMLIMKLTLVLMITAFLQFSFAASAQKVTLQEKNTPLEKVFKKIRLQTGYNIIWNQALLKKTQPVSVNIKDVDLEQAMDMVLEDQDLSFVIKNKTIIVQEKEEVMPKLPVVDVIEIKGKVTDEKGLPIPGVTVKVKSTGKVVITDPNGNYVLQTEQQAVLVFSYIGFKSIEEQVNDRKVINIVLLEDLGQLKEVVVTALGISKDSKKIGYAVTSVKGDLLNQAKEPNVANSLTGRVAGLNVSGVSSGPGSSARILIRGVSNFSSSSSPLFVIDGVPMDNTQKGSPGVYGGQDMGDGISSINPDDIETVTVLNGSSASALYGARAANGVIQITTKSGKGQKGIGVEYSGNFSLNSIVDNTNYQKAYGQGLDGKIPLTSADLVGASLNSWGGKLTGELALGQDGKMHPYLPVENQLDKFYRDAPAFSNTLAFLNGGEKGNMRLSLSQTNNQSVIPNSGLKRYSGNLNINQELISKLKLTAMVNFLNEDVKLRPNLGDMSRNPNFTMGLLPPNVSPDYLKVIYNPDGDLENHLGNGGYIPNPWFVVEKVTSNTRRKRLISSTALRYDFTSELYIQTRMGYDYIADHTLKIEPLGIGYNPKGKLEDLSDATTTEMNLDVLAGYSKKLVTDLSMDVAVGGNIRKFNYEKVGISGSQWKSADFYVPSNLTTLLALYPSPNRSQTNSAYYTLDFNYKNYLTLSNTGRYDRFSTTTKGVFTPSVSASFVFTNLIQIPALTFGKLRLAYAKTSGEALPFRNAKYYVPVSGEADGKPYANLNLEILPEDLNPYTMQELEAGLELKGLKGRFGLVASYFARKTKDELVSQQISLASGGYRSTYIPLGSTQNRGLELTLNGMPIQQRDFSWDVSFNFTLVNNKLLNIDGITTRIQNADEGQYRPTVGPYANGAGVFGVVGLPLAQIMTYDYKYDANGNIIVGNTDGIPLRGTDLKPMGSGLPKYYGGLNNNFVYKSFNLSFLIDYRFGNKVLSATDFLSMYYGLNKKTLEGRENGIVVKGVTEDGKENTKVVSAQDYYPGLVRNVSSVTVFDGSFIKLRQITMGYNLPSSFLKNSPLASVNISFAARNLLTLMKHTENFDPEDTFSSLTGNAGLEGAGLPQTRNYGLSLNIKLK
ncbi:SusC/RagA family TonB-linked outer membrane protein [Pedobacter hiemivivus]|uniref:SusC/RagA family TonB-linked outer membrane protein n=1 Tax=Pedobacter hiemivivus TaxID=2530454 RepID=A0A4R0N748_9SPHI|nr:SusC/RagA family TonB-linked outer membrane protein [Pedobacter hiemivivus]TCC95850.1 SusC/RagA family TonB-linked outer membrane protein [Pedobacter hiemivivus]